MEFLHKDSVAGKTLLNLVARGSAIIAELLRLSDHIPSVFEEKGPNNADAKEREKYDKILFDFKYLKSAELYDEKVDADSDLVDLDEEFRETHFQLLERFYKLFESIHKYIADFATYIEEMTEGVFVQHTVESVLMDVEGKQLMCEALYLYGCMLLLMDIRIPGLTRERMIVSYFRYRGAAGIDNLDDVVKLCRSNGFVSGGKRPANYPEELFARVKLPSAVVHMIIGRLQSDDIYNHTSAFPAPEHRSIALANQASMLYVLLYFAPELLHKKESTMREIADKFFADNWVIPFYMGFHHDLQDGWAPYKAAMAALNNIVSKNNVTEVVTKQAATLDILNTDLDKYLTQGVLTEDFVLTNIRKLMHVSRSCNATLRWCILHRATTNKKFREVIDKAAAVAKLMKLLMNTAHFEAKLKVILKQILDLKQKKWEDCKKESKDRMLELADYFSGEKALTRVSKNASLQQWFKTLAEEIGNLNYDNSITAGRKISTLIQALEDVESFHQIETSLQVKQFLSDTRGFLTQMIRTVNVTQKVMGDLDIVSDFSYAWELINDYTPLLHARVEKKPSVVLLLRAMFLKLCSILSLPLVRISQAGSKDDVSVADYFSSELVAYVRQVLEIIPRSVFLILDQIIQLQTHKLKPVPTKVERKYLKDFSQLDERYTLSKATHEVSVFTQGILAMDTTLMGIIKLDPKQLLEDGIRKELVRQIAATLDTHMVFKTPGKLDDFEQRLQQLGQKLDGVRQSFEYIQDYINVYGLKIWQEEFSRIINYNVEQESNSFLKKKIYDWQSSFQSDAIPIPQFPAVVPANPAIQKQSVNFTGRLVREVLAQTDPKKTVYVESMQGWYDLVTNREVVGIRTFSLLHRGVGIFGLTGLDRLLCFMIVRDLTDFARLYRRIVTKPVSQFVSKLSAELHPTSQFPPNTDKLYSVAQSKTVKLWAPILEFVTKIGQSQLMRRQIANELNFSCKLDSKLLSCALDVMNQSLVNDVKMHYARPNEKPYPGNPLLPDISRYLETAGINSPITKIYITTEALEGLPCLMFLFVLAQLQSLTWSRKLSTLMCTNKNQPLDGAPLVVGVITLLKQFHSSHTHTFLAYLGQYVRAMISAQAAAAAASSAGISGGKGIPPHCVTVLLFLEEFCKFSNMSRKSIDALVPAYIFDRFEH